MFKPFINRLKELKAKRGYSDEQMAEFWGVSLEEYARIESGKIEPPFGNLIVFSRKVKVTIDYLFALVDGETELSAPHCHIIFPED